MGPQMFTMTAEERARFYAAQEKRTADEEFNQHYEAFQHGETPSDYCDYLGSLRSMHGLARDYWQAVADKAPAEERETLCSLMRAAAHIVDMKARQAGVN